MKLDQIERVHLANLPTPLEEAPRLGASADIRKLLIKRDDLTGLALGGNKARKLEYLMAQAIAKGCDTILTNGGPQSNHARMTAAAARKLGLDVKLVLGGPDFEQFHGNLLLDVILGADIIFLKDKDVPEMQAAMETLAEDLVIQGKKPFIIPVGGSTATGALGYVRAMRELSEQLGDTAVQIVVAVGSCGTIAGTVLGAKLFLRGSSVIGISVSRSSASISSRASEIANESSTLIEAGVTVRPEDVVSYDEYYGPKYGIPTAEGNEAIIEAARLEGLVLDPVYTGKAMSGLLDLARQGKIDKERPVVFIHTGGSPGLFAFEPHFHDLAVCEKRPAG